MFSLQRLLNSRWLIPVVAGLLIVVAATLGFSQGVNPFSGTSHGLTNLGDTPNVALLVADLLMIAAAVVAGHRIVMKAIQALTIKDISIDLLVSIAAIGAIIIGSYWEAAAVTWLFAIGHALETATMNKTRSALAELVAVAPDTAVVLRDGEQVEVPAAQVLMDEIVLVKNGAKVPVDGDVVAGTGALNEASITGESIPAEKNTGDQVFAGTISTGGFLQVRATGIGADTTLARIIHRVEEAQDAKARTQTFIDRFSTWYTPAIILLALVTGLITRDVTLALTLLVIGCPGALVISIPVAIVAGIGRAARDGILIKGGEFLENAAKIDAVALDKTGTLTEGRPVLTDVVVTHPDYTRTDVLTWAARAEAGSEHPLARPILDAAAAEDIVYELPEAVTPVVGKGITANVSGRTVLIGNQALMDEFELSDDPAAATAAQDLARAGRTPMIVAVDTDIIGVVAVADQVRPEARQMIDELHAAGVQKVVMLTGDTPLVAHAIGAQTGVDDIRAGLLPEDKLDEVAALQRDGYTVAMVGDGVNDAPALATADIGVAMGAAGSAVAVETADIALMGDKLLRLPQAIALAKRTVAIMRQNIAIALITVVLLLAGVFAGGVTMSIGMLVHEASVLLVIANAMRLMRQVRPTPPSSKAQSKTQSDVASQPQADEPVASATSR